MPEQVATVEFWFEFASTYSYIAAMRVVGEATRAGRRVTPRPFLLGPVFAQQGWNDSPFNLYPLKGRYMWRDMERLCERYALPLRRPSAFPRGSLLAARVAFAAADEPWCLAFVRAVYHANFAEDQDIAKPEVVGQLVEQVGQDRETWLARAQTTAVKDGLRKQTERALALGIFGAPSFIVEGELFWGNDRLEEALAWPGSARLQPTGLAAT